MILYSELVASQILKHWQTLSLQAIESPASCINQVTWPEIFNQL